MAVRPASPSWRQGRQCPYWGSQSPAGPSQDRGSLDEHSKERLRPRQRISISPHPSPVSAPGAQPMCPRARCPLPQAWGRLSFTTLLQPWAQPLWVMDGWAHRRRSPWQPRHPHGNAEPAGARGGAGAEHFPLPARP